MTNQMPFRKTIDYLLDNGGNSIQYRVRRDILGQDIQTDQMKFLHDRILEKHRLKKIFSAQHEDGWIGDELHGQPAKAIESSVYVLLYHGVEKGHTTFRKVAHALLHPKENEPYKRTFPGGPALDQDGRGGDRSITANILALLGHMDNECVRTELDRSLEHFRGALKHTTVDDFTNTTRSGSRTYYVPHALFPGGNHIRLLNATALWRTSENVRMVRTSFSHCMAIMKDAPRVIHFKHKTHYIGPFNFSWQRFPFTIDKIHDDSYAMVWWLRDLGGMTTLGLAKVIPEIAREYEYLQDLLESEEIFKRQTDKSLQRFKQTQILSIENSWRKEESIKSDIFFSALLLLHRAGYA